MNQDQMACYGDMFPNLDRVEYNRPLQGKAFTLLAQSNGIGVSGRSVEVDPEQWDKCTDCDQYRNCYDLSMAKLLLSHALASAT
jgi:hypothetical protein